MQAYGISVNVWSALDHLHTFLAFMCPHFGFVIATEFSVLKNPTAVRTRTDHNGVGEYANKHKSKCLRLLIHTRTAHQVPKVYTIYTTACIKRNRRRIERRRRKRRRKKLILPNRRAGSLNFPLVFQCVLYT